MEALDLLSCVFCKQKLTEVYMLPCMHNFCNMCANLMRNKAETTCLICSNSCHQDDVKRNAFLEKISSVETENKKIENYYCEVCVLVGSANLAEKYCADCSQYICSKCSTVHVKFNSSKNHKIVDKNQVTNLVIKLPEPCCIKHKQNFSIYCNTCDSMMCATCCSMDLLHSNHEKSDNHLVLFAKSKYYIKNKIIEVNDALEAQQKILQDYKISESNLLKNCDEVRKEIENYAKELKDKIDNFTKENFERINTFETDFINSLQASIKEISNHISSLTNLKSYCQEVINKGSNVDVFNAKKDLGKIFGIETKKPKLSQKINLFFQKPTLETLISTEFSESLKVYEIKDLKLKLKNKTASACVYKQKFCTINKIDGCIDMFDIETGEYQTSIRYKKDFIKDPISFDFILNTKDDIFLYYNSKYSKCTYIVKFNLNNETFVELKPLEYTCSITTTLQQTLLVRTESNELIELSANGDELKRIIIPQKAILQSLYFYNTAHQLADGQYVVTSNDRQSLQVSLLNSRGTFIKSFTHSSSDDYIRTCTDGEKFIFVLDWSAREIIVLSTDLQDLHRFESPGVENLFYDRVNDNLLLVKKDEIIYLTYCLGMKSSLFI